jgi:uncharacterized protein YxeA
MDTKIIIAIIVVAILVLGYWYHNKGENFNPRYDSTYANSAMNQQNDYMKDPAGYTNDDYYLANIVNDRGSSK